ncbi:HAD-IIA family hydrolase [Virgisporangium ochraceum]|uniref:Haloacid dehalogenase n=1 Tax=Virgisporangium ochraceum TaxID=65505 RepID=A0A8J4A0D3_9ACTN|nr:HAD-IIA family hydrolase [Virgisporangium ochraceum]GIJ72871.1 haloacid dehalogenase [Virgisporangium ochraceum]
MSDDRLSERLAGVEGLVFDVDGCLILSSQPAGHDGTALPGAVEAVAALRASGRRLVAFTNASNRPPRRIAESLRELGFDFPDEDVLTPSVVAADVVRQRFGDAPVLAFGATGVVDVLAKAGVRLATPGDGTAVAAVVVGWDTAFDQPKLQAAAEAIWAGAPLLVTSDAPAFATKGRRTAGVSGFIATGLAHIAGQTYEVVGKPSLLAASTAAARLGVPPERMLVVGDDLSLEVAMARRVGAVGVLITTGVCSRTDADAAAEGQRPHLVVDSLLELATLMLASATA